MSTRDPAITRSDTGTVDFDLGHIALSFPVFTRICKQACVDAGSEMTRGIGSRSDTARAHTPVPPQEHRRCPQPRGRLSASIADQVVGGNTARAPARLRQARSRPLKASTIAVTGMLPRARS